MGPDWASCPRMVGMQTSTPVRARKTLIPIIQHPARRADRVDGREICSGGVALAQEWWNRSIIDTNLQRLQYLRETGTLHQMIAAACSVDHAPRVPSLFAERDLPAREIHSNTPRRETRWAFQ